MVPGRDWLVARYNVILNSSPKAATVRALARRAADFDNVAAAAIAVAATGTDPNLLPPLVELAFPPWAGPLPPPDNNRVKFLQALACNDAMWIPSFIMPVQEALAESALPTTQSALRNLYLRRRGPDLGTR